MKILLLSSLLLISTSVFADPFDEKKCQMDYISCLAKEQEKDFPKVEYPDPLKWNTFKDYSDKRIILEGSGSLYSDENFKFEGGFSYQLPNEDYFSNRDNSYDIKASFSFAL
ncbi:MAG: hypothetical protein MJ250_01700 [Alphaproteobacteria bacterium]|nr:hypothetical protein [Alphaproteobacteria bacterium]